MPTLLLVVSTPKDGPKSIARRGFCPLGAHLALGCFGLLVPTKNGSTSVGNDYYYFATVTLDHMGQLFSACFEVCVGRFDGRHVPQTVKYEPC